jgi:hypothetical protein
VTLTYKCLYRQRTARLWLQLVEHTCHKIIPLQASRVNIRITVLYSLEIIERYAIIVLVPW